MLTYHKTQLNGTFRLARDHTARLWDVVSQRCRQTFRGHVDSVNAVAWQPFTNNLCTGSGDKTVSLWDARSGLCMQVRGGGDQGYVGIDVRRSGAQRPTYCRVLVCCIAWEEYVVPTGTILVASDFRSDQGVGLQLHWYSFAANALLVFPGAACRARPSTATRTQSTTYAVVSGATW